MFPFWTDITHKIYYCHTTFSSLVNPSRLAYDTVGCFLVGWQERHHELRSYLLCRPSFNTRRGSSGFKIPKFPQLIRLVRLIIILIGLAHLPPWRSVVGNQVVQEHCGSLSRRHQLWQALLSRVFDDLTITLPPCYAHIFQCGACWNTSFPHGQN
jgi:hypothetical protein